MTNMNTFWLKVAVVIVVIIAVVMAINKFSGPKKQTARPVKQEKTIGDTWREDEKRLRAEPNLPAQPATGQQATTAEQPRPVQFKELTEEQQAGAEQLFEWAIKCREMARLPGAGGYGKMVSACRDIIEKYPGSEFDYKARRMLGEVPREKWDQYKITQEEINGPWK
jgi:type IV secretory pathway VirB10-like protein